MEMKAYFSKQTLVSLLAVLALAWVSQSCQSDPKDYQQQAYNPELFQRSMKALTDVIVHDIFSPPVASRIYAYPSIAAYEVMVHDRKDFKTLAGQLRGLQPVPTPAQGQTVCYPLASIHAFLTVGKTLIFSEDKIEAYQQQVYQQYKDMGVPSSIIESSMVYGQAVADHIIAWSDADNYKQTRTFPKFEVYSDDPVRWQPTPPDYMDPIEPHWNKIRPFVIDSAQQFKPDGPTEFDMTQGSTFYKEVLEVYETGKNLTDEEVAIASFWDCNPYVSHHKGHLMFATKKITPGGHWIGITAIATRKAGADFAETTETYAKVSLTIADAFISCWDEKYRSSLIRPETVINQYIDEAWQPALQTPPFPEYTSGHSVVSGSAGIVLTSIFGDGFAFNDTTEVEYGLPARQFTSFNKASDEAAISRLYGGIHYMPAITNGVTQGRQLGRYIVGRISTRKDKAQLPQQTAPGNTNTSTITETE